MIRIVVVLLLVIAVFISLVVFPDIANQRVRIEMLGWLFETRTAMFVLLLTTVVTGLWFIQKTFDLSVNSPKQLWQNIRSGSHKRRELRLQEALDTWIDEGEGKSQKLLKRSKGVAPQWLHDALIIWWDKPENHAPINDEKDASHIIALKARLATENPKESLSPSVQQQYLDAWLMVHPAAPLALARKAELLGKQGEYREQVALLESLFQKKKSIESIKPKLAQALLHLAQHDEANTLAHLRKAYRLMPHDAAICQHLALALADSGDRASGERLLLDYLQQHNNISIAQEALKLLSLDALKNFKRVDKPAFQNSNAGRWLRMMLAYEADLTGIADDAMRAMLAQQPSTLLWQTQGDWLAAKHEWEKAAQCYQKALSASMITSRVM
ncbi:MAG: hypothetical protein Q9N67_05995 [Ghiorsea sp.]|nr:hypothetical protein [Ghiorsea sp.]